MVFSQLKINSNGKGKTGSHNYRSDFHHSGSNLFNYRPILRFSRGNGTWSHIILRHLPELRAIIGSLKAASF
jgi:hypothetical protein